VNWKSGILQFRVSRKKVPVQENAGLWILAGNLSSFGRFTGTTTIKEKGLKSGCAKPNDAFNSF